MSAAKDSAGSSSGEEAKQRSERGKGAAEKMKMVREMATCGCRLSTKCELLPAAMERTPKSCRSRPRPGGSADAVQLGSPLD